MSPDSASTSSETRVDLDATDRYGFVMPNPTNAYAQAPATEPAARDKDTETRRIAKWRKMLGESHAHDPYSVQMTVASAA